MLQMVFFRTYAKNENAIVKRKYNVKFHLCIMCMCMCTVNIHISIWENKVNCSECIKRLQAMRDFAAVIVGFGFFFLFFESNVIVSAISIGILYLKSHKQIWPRCVPPYQFAYTFHISIVCDIELMKCIKLR